MTIINESDENENTNSFEVKYGRKKYTFSVKSTRQILTRMCYPNTTKLQLYHLMNM